MPAALGVALGLLLALTGLPLATASAAPADGVAVLHLEGRGHGHGVGLSQWGARSMAAAGHDAATILGHYYPGTAIGNMAGEVVVVVGGGGRTTLRLPQGGELRSARGGQQAAGFPIAVGPGDTVTIHHDGSGYRVERGGVQGLSAQQAQPFQADDCVILCPPSEREPEPEPRPEPEPAPEPEPQPAPEPCVVCPPPGGEPAPAPPAPEQPPAPGQPAPAPAEAPRSPTPIWAVPNGGGTVHLADRGRTYRGQLEVAGVPGALRIRNHLDVEDYLRGMAEVPGAWPAAAVQAQAVAARTYALRAMAGGGEICDTESCQVYAGVEREHPGQDAAVAATRGWVLTHAGTLAATFYSASAGGHSATIQEGFGSGYDIPYLQARPEPTEDVRPWSLDVALSDVAARLGYPGPLRAVRVDAAGPSGRPLAMTLVGDAGDRPVDPQVFRRRLGLRSTLFTARAGVAGEAPPPPPAPVLDQLVDPSQATEAPAVRSASAGRQLAMAAPRHLPPAGPHAAAQVGRVTALVALLAAAAVAGKVGRPRLAAMMTGWTLPRRRR
ncbi:MAG TPA: SpoIID/LytB domain-containing protein [Acidimicrobiales bacterium]|nr:SpoIID/LytB domain-containing protein [Acidimicrobiales bacterium]